MNIYHDLCVEIETYEIRCEQLEREITQIYKLMDKGPKTKLVATWSDMPTAGSDETPFERLYERFITVEQRLNAERDILTDKKMVLKNIEDKMSQFETLDYKVAYKRDIEGKSLSQISDEVILSYSTVSKISSRIGKNAKSMKEMIVR